MLKTTLIARVAYITFVLFGSLIGECCHAGTKEKVEISRLDLALATGKDAAAIFGKQRASFLYPDGLLSAQLTEPLNESGDHADSIKNVGEELVFFAGCRPHSCDEKSSAIVNKKTGKISIIALRNFQCHLNRKLETECDVEPSIDIFYVASRFNADKRTILATVIDDWSVRVGGKKRIHECRIENNLAKCT